MYKLWEMIQSLRERLIKLLKIKSVRYFVVPMLLVAAAGFLVLYGLSWIPVQEIDFTKKITTIDSDEVPDAHSQYDNNDTITVQGKVYNPWFSDGFFVGNVDFENNDEFSRELTLSTSNVKIGSVLYDPSDGYMYDTPIKSYIVEYIKPSDVENMTQDNVLRIRFNMHDDDCENLYVGIDHKEGTILAKEE